MTSTTGRALDVEGRRILVRGTVQGVGFRPWVYRLALEEGLSGRVRNDALGVTIEAFGLPEALEAFRKRLGTESPPAARLHEVREEPIPAESLPGLRDRRERASGGAAGVDPARPRHVPRVPARGARSVGPAPLPCLHQLHALRAALHDRPRRAVRPAGDHDGRLPDVPGLPARVRRPARPALPRPADRLSRLRPAACARWTASGTRRVTRRDAIAAAAADLRAGRIVAVKGLGGYHLACDATSAAAVRPASRRASSGTRSRSR